MFTGGPCRRSRIGGTDEVSGHRDHRRQGSRRGGRDAIEARQTIDVTGQVICPRNSSTCTATGQEIAEQRLQAFGRSHGRPSNWKPASIPVAKGICPGPAPRGRPINYGYATSWGARPNDRNSQGPIPTATSETLLHHLGFPELAGASPPPLRRAPHSRTPRKTIWPQALSESGVVVGYAPKSDPVE